MTSGIWQWPSTANSGYGKLQAPNCSSLSQYLFGIFRSQRECLGVHRPTATGGRVGEHRETLELGHTFVLA